MSDVRRAVLLAVMVMIPAACRNRDCPEGMKVKSKADGVLWCQTPDGKSARWIELHKNGQRRQSCGFREGRPEGSFTSWHPKGQVWMQGEYRGGVKVGIWSQWDDIGQKTAQGEYRGGTFVAGAPVGAQAPCERLTP